MLMIGGAATSIIAFSSHKKAEQLLAGAARGTFDLTYKAEIVVAIFSLIICMVVKDMDFGRRLSKAVDEAHNQGAGGLDKKG